MCRTIPGLHHLTAICVPPQANVDFYAGLLNQRRVKKTVNFDARSRIPDLLGCRCCRSADR